VTALGGCSIPTRRPIESNSALAAAMGDDGDDEAGGMRLVVTIPDGVEAGQALLVEVPSGREMSVRDCHCLSPRRSHRASAAAAHHS
jgi:hypothetical protein